MVAVTQQFIALFIVAGRSYWLGATLFMEIERCQ